MPPEVVSLEKWARESWNIADNLPTPRRHRRLSLPPLPCVPGGGVGMSSGVLHNSSPPSPSTTRGGEREQLTRSLAALGTRLRAKGLLPPSFIESHEKLFRTRLPTESWLPVDLLNGLLMSCRRWSVFRCALCACLLQCLPEETMEYFTMNCSLELSKYVFELGERWRGREEAGGSEADERGERESVRGGGGEEGRAWDEGSELLESGLFLLAVYLTIALSIGTY